MGFRSRKDALQHFGDEIAARFDPPTGAVAVAEGERTPIGEVLVEQGTLSTDQLRDALAAQESTTSRLGELLVASGVLTPQDLVGALSAQLGLPVADLRRESPSGDAIARLTEGDARALGVLPLRVTDATVDVVAGDPLVEDLVAALERATGADVALYLAPPEDVARAIDNHYRAAGRVGDAVRAFEVIQSARPHEDVETRVTVDENAPIVQVVNLILEQAVRDRASDVHIEPCSDHVLVRNRTDGALHEAFRLPHSMGLSLASRIKILADLNIVERRRGQDGQFELKVAGHDLDVRVSTAPTMFGETCVLRLLDKSRALLALHELGMPVATAEQYRDLVRSPYGMVVCTGPTGSGKTTTLYATLSEINRTEINVMTIEDPVEYIFERINQIQINEASGVTFANGLRTILRQDPDAILIGEIRDVETARIAVQSALTGHFVMSSLHATDSIAALHRFLDMGIESFLIASSVLGVVAQRLVRRICPSCKTPYEPSKEELALYERAEGPETATFFRGEGCNFCAHTGYFDRVGVYEVLRVTDDVRSLILENAPNEVIRKTAVQQGMRTLANEAAALVATGDTTISEVLRTIFVSEVSD